MKKDINISELKEAIGEEGIKRLLEYIQASIKKGIDNKIEMLYSININDYK